MSAVSGIGSNGPPDQTAHYNRLEAEFADVLQLRDCFSRRIHRYRRHRRETVGEIPECIGNIHVERMADGLAYLVIANRMNAEALGRVKYSEIEPQFIHTLIEQFRNHRSCP